MKEYIVSIDASCSDEFFITAKNRAEAKKKALKRFAKLKNFRFDITEYKE